MPDATPPSDLGPPDVVTIDAPSDRSCPMSPSGPIEPRTCPSCLAGRWALLGGGIAGLRDEASLEISGCGSAFRCLLGGAARTCLMESSGLRLYVDVVGYRQVIFRSLACDRMLGVYFSKGGNSGSMRAEYQGDLSDAGAATDACATAPTDAIVRRAPCGPCGARYFVNDAGAMECERFTNACGGCATSIMAPGSSCGPDRYYLCTGPDQVDCTFGSADGLNACGWRAGPLSPAPGDRCGAEPECRYVCQLTGPERRETVSCWCPPSGDAGVPDVPAADAPDAALPPLAGAAQVVAGSHHTCARMLDGTVRCWGRNYEGQLGDGTMERRTVPTLVAGLTDVEALSARAGHTCARTREGAVWCWGENYWGQLGDGTALTRFVPTRVPGLAGVAQVATGAEHTCARLTDGTVRCWGGNRVGQLGDGTTTLHLAPTPVPGLAGVTDLAVGDDHACARTADLSVWCWGRNTAGELGDGSITDRPSPVAIAALATATQVTLGRTRGCARMADATARCWGTNYRDLLGLGVTDMLVSTPTTVPALTSVAGVAVGEAHTCAWMTDGTARCWGSNGWGVLGDGTTTDRTTPTPVAGLVGVVELALGSYHSCARTADGRVRCWGPNNAGQLGDGTSQDRLVPTLVE